MPVTCITNYYNCMYGLLLEYQEKIRENPAEADRIKRKLDQVNALAALYYNADQASDDDSKTLHCAEIRTLFEGDDCLSGGVAGNVANVATGTFTNASLVAGVLSVTHNLGTLAIAAVVVINPSGLGEVATTWTVIDEDNITIDFGGAIGAGTFTWVVTGVITV